ncbi:putative N-acetyltransferase YhbS [Rheinheimera pacifica]|uniref:GNAT family N-acetyltransferase n=1 Tax=Rheinheimera pacifica TaxID=173990 RepID=UPI00285F404B|nr:GNAT family N-acetyltransferase [Rheinheimera pacifica]MDR6982627.1 putative N-acetyltransferase YhbS [Rheinheimera pacifica]
MSIRIRLINEADLGAIVAIQDSCYAAELFEDAGLIRRRLASQPHSCWLAENSAGEVLAYLFSYPSRNKQVAPLGSTFGSYADAELLYLHDLAVSHNARGMRLAPQLLACAEQYAAELGFHTLALVAVQGSVTYWQKHGFEVQTLTDTAALQALASYTGQNAVYMQKLLKA